MPQRLQKARILFLLTEGFSSRHVTPLQDCLRGEGATIFTASFNRGDTLTSQDGEMRVTSDYAFATAAQEIFDAVILADNVTAEAILENPAAMNTVTTAWERGKAVVAIEKGVLALIGAGIADNALVTTPPEYRDDLLNAGAKIAATPIAMRENILTARQDADMQILCADIVSFLAGRQTKAA